MTPSAYSVLNASYPGHLTGPVQWPVSTDVNASIAITGALATQLQIGRPYDKSIEAAIQACDRHVYVHGKPENPMMFVQDFLNLLRWEVQQLWAVDPLTRTLTRSTSYHLTHEHHMRSGELLAEGLALEFLRERLSIRRQRFYFYQASDARPDFLVTVPRRAHLAVINAGRKWGLEVRLRKCAPSLDKDEVAALTRKKSNRHFDRVIAIYVMYGTTKHRNGNASTRLHVVDPEEADSAPASEMDFQLAAIQHYIRLTSQIGLWEYRDHLRSAVNAFMSERLHGLPRLSIATGQVRTGIRRTINGQNYRGREFNEFLALTSGPMTPTSRAVARSRIEAGDFGSTVFRGLHELVLHAIAENDWAALSDFERPEITIDFEHERGDGLGERTIIIDAKSPEAELIRNALK